MLKFLKRFLLIVLGLLVVLILFLVGSVVVDTAAGGQRLQAVTNTTIPGSGGAPDVRAYIARPQGPGPFPAVIMIHEFFGLNESIVGKAEGLAQEGYLVIAPDTFRGSTTSWIPRAIYQVITSRPEQVNQDLDTVFSWVAAQKDVDPRRIGVMGFCYGGRASLTYSLHNNRLAATAVFYGSPESDPNVLRSLPGPVLGIFGGADASIPLSEVEGFRKGLQQAGIPHQVTVYDGQPHAFVTDIESIRKGGVQGQAWSELLAFLDKNLRQSKASLSPAQAASVDYQAPFAWGYYLALAYEHAFGSASHQH